MQITCTGCRRQLNLPDEKVPAQPFALTCPACKTKIHVNPSALSAAAPGAAAPGAAAQEFEPLPPVRDLDKELFGELHRIAAVVRLAAVPVERFEAGLRLLGMEEVRHYDSLAAATEEMLDVDFAVLLLVMDRATAPPCEPLKPLYDLPLSVRRGTFVALAADNVRSLDGQTAFYLQVNCLINSQEPARIPGQLLRALLFHLRHYRHWGVRAE
jgi:hypothetical protein